MSFRINYALRALALVLLAACQVAHAQQVEDLEYKPPVPRPAYVTDRGPRVGIDEAHHNFHTVNGRYRPFAALLRLDGYRVRAFTSRALRDALSEVDVLVIANPLNERNVRDWSLPTPSAFTPVEVTALREWVEQGGALLLIADHMPFPGAASEVARAFGAEFSNGYARDGRWRPSQPNDFDLAAGLRESAVTRGRFPEEKISRVVTFGGSAFKLPSGAEPVLVFGPGSISFETPKAPGIAPGSPRVDIAGWSQGAVMAVGRGRLAIFGEAAMFSAQRIGPEKRPMGMNHPEAQQNHQLLLNLMRWLSRAEGMAE